MKKIKINRNAKEATYIENIICNNIKTSVGF